MSKDNGIADEWRSWTYLGLVSILSILALLTIFFLNVFKVTNISKWYQFALIILFIISIVLSRYLLSRYIKNKPKPSYIN